MARPLTHRAVEHRPAPTVRPWSAARSAARALAAAVTALLVATLVVNRSAQAIDETGTVGTASVASGTIALTDNDRGRSLFDLTDLGPDRPLARCITIVYEGTIVPVDLRLVAEAGGDLAPFLDLTIVEGAGGAVASCEGFEAERTVFAGTLAGLVDAGPTDLGTLVNTGDQRSYRVEVTLQDESDALGRSTALDLRWVVTPS